jgi:hypothetical protein
MSGKNRVGGSRSYMFSCIADCDFRPADKPATETDIARRFGRRLPTKLRFA